MYGFRNPSIRSLLPKRKLRKIHDLAVQNYAVQSKNRTLDVWKNPYVENIKLKAVGCWLIAVS
jgi:hypothetical protein